MFRLLPALLLCSACGSAVGQVYDEAKVAKLEMGSATIATVKAQVGGPFRASLFFGDKPPEGCAAPEEVWIYLYDDDGKNVCRSELYFDAAGKLCARTTSATARGERCSGVPK